MHVYVLDATIINITCAMYQGGGSQCLPDEDPVAGELQPPAYQQEKEGGTSSKELKSKLVTLLPYLHKYI